MPLRTYRPLKSPCRLCGTGFEWMETASQPPLTLCPKCGQGVECVATSTVHSPRITQPVSISDAKAAGFTVLKRTSSGEFEKQ